MKKAARIGHRRTGTQVTIAEVYDASAAVKAEWERLGYFDEQSGRRMYPMLKFPPRSRRFAFMPGRSGPGTGSDGETWTHEFAKQSVLERRVLHVRHGGETFTLAFSAAHDEVDWITLTGTPYRFDLVARVVGPEHIVRKWGKLLIIEVCVFHPTENQKIADIARKNVTAIEIEIEQDIARSEQADMSPAAIDLIQRRVFRWLDYARPITVMHLRTVIPPAPVVPVVPRVAIIPAPAPVLPPAPAPVRVEAAAPTPVSPAPQHRLSWRERLARWFGW